MFFSSNSKNIYKINSDKGGYYRVYDSPQGRYLTLRNKVIGVHRNYKGLKNTYFYDLFEELKEIKSSINNALIFGLGAQTLQNLLIEFYPKIKITTIDSDSSLLDINDYFFHREKNTNNSIILSDAFQFVKNSESLFDFHDKCDLVVVDFNLLGTHFYSEVFLKEVKNFLTHKGVFLIIFERKNYFQNFEIFKFVQRISLYYNKVTLLYSKNNILGVLCSDN